MSPSSPLESIRALLEASLDADEAARILSGLERLDLPLQKSAVNIGLILSDFSTKGATEYFRAVPSVLQSIDPDELAGWVGMGIQIAQQSSAAGIRFFKQGSAVFSKLPSKPLRDVFLKLGLSLSQRDYNLAMEYYQQAPALLANVALTEAALAEWAEHGFALGKQDYTLAVEYFRTTPSLLVLLPIELLPKWIAAGQKLSAGKVLATLQFVRTSPEVFTKISSNADRVRLLDLTAEVAERNPILAAKLFTEAASILPPFQTLHLEGVLLDKALTLARFDGELAATLFLNGPKILKEMGRAAPHFPEWVAEGMALVKQGPGAGGLGSAKAFFSFESKAAREVVDHFGTGVSLASVSRMLKLFAEALSGRPVAIQPLSSMKSEGKTNAEAPTTDGQTIYLPDHVNRFPDKALNLEWYKVATAYQAGYLEFNTFTPKIQDTADLIESLQIKYKRRGGLSSLTSFFSLFPEPALIQRLFEIAEGARIEYLLKQEYPGLRSALIRMRETDLARRPPLTGLSPRGVIVELLHQISLTGKTKEPIPPALQSTLFEACRMLGAVQNPDAPVPVAYSMRAAARVYELLEVDQAEPTPATGDMETFEERGSPVRGEGEGAGMIAPSTRGVIDPKRVEETKKATQAQADALLEKLKGAGVDLSTEAAVAALSGSIQRGEATLESLQQGGALDAIAEQMIAGRTAPGAAGGGRRFRYDEWDCESGDYRPGWCQVIERPVPAGTPDAVEAILAEYGGMIQSIQTAFQHLRPEGLKRIKGEREGDELDLDALLQSRVEMKSGRSPSDRIYVARQKKERSVAIAFLIDISGSTQQPLPPSPKSGLFGDPQNAGKRIVQIEKEALVLLSKAIDAVGDRFALYGFSGRGKESVDFYVIKDFDERYSSEIDRRIGQIEAAAQNRDGAAIRHAVRKLAAQPSKVKVLALISDGKPLDDQYSGSYSTADTKMALREAKRQGIHPYCITVDREGPEYLRGMYGEVAYLVIDQVETLPVKLPQIYRRLTT